jgi:hypothetical protein
MIQPTEKQLRSIVRLTQDEDFADFIDLLNSSISQMNTELPKIPDEISIRWMQGRLQELLDIRNIIDNASETVKAFLYGQGRKAPNI